MITKSLNASFIEGSVQTDTFIKLVYGAKAYDLIKQDIAFTRDNRYWHDHQGQPRRNPTKQPLLHNGKAHRK